MRPRAPGQDRCQAFAGAWQPLRQFSTADVQRRFDRRFDSIDKSLTSLNQQVGNLSDYAGLAAEQYVRARVQQQALVPADIVCRARIVSPDEALSVIVGQLGAAVLRSATHETWIDTLSQGP